MTWLPKQCTDVVTFIATPDVLACAWIAPEKKGRYSLKAYKRMPLAQDELVHMRINQPTRFAQKLHSFLQKHHLLHERLVGALQGPAVYEQIVSLPTFSPKNHAIPFPRWRHYVCNYHYLYP